jgi:pimeloyl-ACP methyl ester carboxylesterase
MLEAPMGSVATLVADGSYLDLPSSYVTTYKGKNTEKIKAIEIPLLWLHGTKDETLNRETNGVPIWNNYPGAEGYFMRVEGAGHATIPQTIGYADYAAIVKDFISGHASDNVHLTRK